MDKKLIKNLINKSNPIIFEIGCADGLDTIEFLSVFDSNLTLYCFEPDSRNAHTFLNGGYRPLKPEFYSGINSNCIIFENKAIGNIVGKIEFNVSSTIYSSSLKKPTNELFQTWPMISFDKVEIVDCVTLDYYTELQNIELIDFVWADVQGAEDLLISGGKKTFENKIRYFYTEYSSKEYYNGALNRDSILNLLGDSWEIIGDYGSDVLLKNKKIN